MKIEDQLKLEIYQLEARITASTKKIYMIKLLYFCHTGTHLTIPKLTKVKL